MKISLYWLPVVFYLGFITRCLLTISCRRFVKRTFGRLPHF